MSNAYEFNYRRIGNMAGRYCPELNLFSMKKNVYKNVDSLIQGIETILSENRCSFSDDEKVLLTETLSFLKKSKKIGSKKPIDWSLIMKGLELLAKVFSDSDGFTNIF